MNFIRKTLLFVLIGALALPLLCACGDETDSSSVASSVSTGTASTGDTSDSNDVKPAVIDLNDREIKILCWDWTAGSNSIFGYTGEVLYRNPDEENATAIDVRKKEVIDYVETEYNCTISGDITNSDSFLQDVYNMVTTGTYEYDIIFESGHYAQNMLSNSLLTDLNTVSTLNLENSWWDQNAVKDLSIGNRLFWICGDINTYDNLGTWCVMFNKNLKDELGITRDFYQMAKDGTWTWDAFMEICKGVTRDTTGEGVVDENDQWALGTEKFNIYAQVVGAGIRVCDKDDDDLPYFTVTNQTERTYNALDKVISFYLGDEVMVADGGKYDNKGYTNVFESTVNKAFKEGRELFYMGGLINVAGFRSMDDEFGILPIPKTFAEQDTYYHTVSPGNSSYMVIPYGVPGVEELGVVIEALAMKSQELVTPEFYDNQLKYRDTRDDESAEMLDMIFATRSFDLGPIYDWGSIMNCYYTMDQNYASRFDSILDAAETKMEGFIEQLQNYGA